VEREGVLTGPPQLQRRRGGVAGAGAREKKSTLYLLRPAPGARGRSKLPRAATRTWSRRRLLRARRTATTRGKLGEDGLRGEAGLEPVDGDVVCPGANLEQEGLLGALEHEVGAVVEGLERRNMSITADKNVGDVLELAINP